MNKTKLHRYNYKELLEGCTLEFPTIIKRFEECGGNVMALTERELGISDSHRQMRVIYREDLLPVCRVVAQKIKKLANGDIYLKAWESLIGYLETLEPDLSYHDEKEDSGAPIAHFAVGSMLPEKWIPSCASAYDASVSLHTVSGSDLTCLFRLTSPTEREISEFGEEVIVTLFAKDHIPFLIFTFQSMYFETAIIQKNLVENANIVFYHLIDSNNNIIVAQGTLGIPKELLVKVSNILGNSPHKSLQDADKRAGEIRSLVSYEEMIKLGKSIQINPLH